MQGRRRVPDLRSSGPEGLTGVRLAATFPASGKTTGEVGITESGGVGGMIGRIRVGAVVSLMVALLVVVGCGGGGAPESSTPPGTLYVALEAEPPELDPNLSSAYVDRQVMASLYDKLVDIDKDGEIVPMLA